MKMDFEYVSKVRISFDIEEVSLEEWKKKLEHINNIILINSLGSEWKNEHEVDVYGYLSMLENLRIQLERI